MCCFHDLFKTACSILVQLPSSLFSRRLVRVQLVQPYSSTDTTTAWKNCLFSLSVKSDFHMTDNLFIADHAFPIHVLTSLSVEEILLPSLYLTDTRISNKCENSKRKIIWFTPPYSLNVRTNVGRKFLELIDKHFPSKHKYHTILTKIQ